MVRSLTVEDYDEICAWLQDDADKSRGDTSIDMDALMRARFGTTEDD